MALLLLLLLLSNLLITVVLVQDTAIDLRYFFTLNFTQ